jgi:amidase
VSTFITRFQTSGDGPRVAVKDIIDMAGVVTTAGSRALERTADPASVDAACLAGARAAGARIVGKTNLHELAMLPLGTNPWFGTPVNPLDPTLIPGGSSSGAAVAVATDEADVAYGSDTGGSVRIPAACCGVAGLKTTHGRISLDGVWPLAPALDTIGPLARDVAGLVVGMQLLEPGFAVATPPARRIGRMRTAGDPRIEAAVDRALQAAGLEVVPVDLSLEDGAGPFMSAYMTQMWEADHALFDEHPDLLAPDIAIMLAMAPAFRVDADEVQRQLAEWRGTVAGVFDQVDLLALPTLPTLPPRLDDIGDDPTELVIALTAHVSAFNAAGVPATAQPVPMEGTDLPASLQLVGPHGSEALLLATATVVESTVKKQ